MDKTQISNEKKLTLLLLCWLFGILAIHRFYTGKYLAGSLHFLILGLACFLAYLNVGISQPSAIVLIAALFLWWVIDALLIIMGKFTDKEGRPIIDWV
jgi:TM2 domain-containing membrane protein YozV